jgi:hypothetical protein
MAAGCSSLLTAEEDEKIFFTGWIVQNCRRQDVLRSTQVVGTVVGTICVLLFTNAERASPGDNLTSLINFELIYHY